MNFDHIKYYYDAGLWNKVMVKMAVKKGVISKEEYAEIVGEEF